MVSMTIRMSDKIFLVYFGHIFAFFTNQLHMAMIFPFFIGNISALPFSLNFRTEIRENIILIRLFDLNDSLLRPF